MLIAMLLANSLFDEPPLLRARFDLAAVRAPTPNVITPVRSRYRVSEPILHTDPTGERIEVRLRWKRVRLRMPIPSL